MTTSLSKLTTAELKNCQKILSEGLEELRKVKSKALEDKKITRDQFADILSYQLKLESLEGEITLLIMDKNLDELDTNAPSSPGAKIVAATKKLNEANSKLADFNKFLNLLANLVNLFGAIANAIRIPSLASIDSILQVINTL
jgi:hypothetical protein